VKYWYYWKGDEVPFESIVGKTFSSITHDQSDDRVVFLSSEGETYVMGHSEECCEHVYLEDTSGDLIDLVGTPILMAEKVSNKENPKEPEDAEYGDFEWTFYKLATVKGHVTLRWYGTSNGFYGVGVDFVKMK